MICILLGGLWTVYRLRMQPHVGRPPQHIYIADPDNYRIVRIDDMTGKNWHSFGHRSRGGDEIDGFLHVGPMFVDNQDHLYIAHRGVCRMDDVSGNNTMCLDAVIHKLGSFYTYCVDRHGHLYLATANYNDTVNTDMIVRFDDMTGKNPVAYGGSKGSGRGHFDRPGALYVDAQDRIYIADSGNFRIVRIDDMTGKNWTEFGTFGLGRSQFYGPESISMDHKGRIYVMDAHGLIRMDDMTGKNWTTLQAGPGKQPVAMYTVWLDDQDHIYISDYYLGVVRVDDMTGKNWIAFRSIPPHTLGGVTAVCVY